MSAELQEPSLPPLPRRRLIDFLQVRHKRLAILPRHILQAVADLVDHAALDLRLWEDRLDRLLEAGQAVDARDEDVLHAPRLQVTHYGQPEVGPFAPVPDPMPQYIALPVAIHA